MTSLSEAPDNTFQGAADRLTKFTAFKSTHKSKVFSEHISLQAIMTNLASRLADNKRPEFCPVAPLDVQSRAQALDDIQDIEQRVAAALYEVGDNKLGRLTCSTSAATIDKQAIHLTGGWA